MDETTRTGSWTSPRHRAQGEGARRREAGRPGSDLAVTVLSGIAIALPLVFYLHQHVEMLRAGYDIESLERRRTELSDRHGELQARKLAVASYDRVEQAATELGLVAPDPRDLVVLPGSPAGQRPGPGEGRGGPVLTTARMD